jgi:D-glycero-alpha-D-manno-heptose-7-phosphate kinase
LTASVRRARTAAPCRADLAGGTLDIWPLGLLHPGAVTVSMALGVEVELEADLGGDAGWVSHTTPRGEVRRLERADASRDLTAAVAFALVEEGGVRVRVAKQAPYRSGLGGSSAYGVALARAIAECLDRVPDAADLVALVRDLEAIVLGVPTGVQDHWAAVRGGVLAVHPAPGDVRVERLDIDLDRLAERATVYFTGIRHRSGMVNWAVIRRRLDGDPEVVSAFDDIAAAAGDCRAALIAADDDAVADAVRREWAARRRLAPEVAPPELDRVIDAATAAGASAVKACGAGGGGSLVVWHPSGARDVIVRRLNAVSDGGRVLAAGASRLGCRVTSGS